MKKTVAIVAIIMLLFATLASIGGAIYLYSRLRKSSSEISNLKSENEDFEKEISNLETQVEELEDELGIEEEDTGDEEMPDEDLEDDCYHVSDDGNFVVTLPCTNDTLGSTFKIQGKAITFEAHFAVRIKDSEGNELFLKNTMYQGGDYTSLNPFEETLTWTPPTTHGTGKIEFFDDSPQDGSEILLVSFPINF